LQIDRIPGLRRDLPIQIYAMSADRIFELWLADPQASMHDLVARENSLLARIDPSEGFSPPPLKQYLERAEESLYSDSDSARLREALVRHAAFRSFEAPGSAPDPNGVTIAETAADFCIQALRNEIHHFRYGTIRSNLLAEEMPQIGKWLYRLLPPLYEAIDRV